MERLGIAAFFAAAAIAAVALTTGASVAVYGLTLALALLAARFAA